MRKYEYDWEFWSAMDKATWRSLKRCASVVFCTLIGVLLTLAMQPVRLYEYLRYRWYNREEAVIEREAQERFENLKNTGHI